MKKKKASLLKKISQKEQKIEQKEEEIENLERRSLAELEKLERLEKKVSREVAPHALLKITYRDLIRSAIGSLVGILGHFSFFYGLEIAEKISVLRATVLYLVALVIAFGFMYYSGFRKVKEIKIISFIPLRALVVYLTALVMILIVLFLFGFVSLSTPWEVVYKSISTLSLLAVLGASTADILGHE